MFEMAAELLGIPYLVLMPTDNPLRSIDKEVVICKVHGSISDNQGRYNPKGLWTTMTSITKINLAWVNYINTWMKNKNICFVGYSGRDIDYFPYINKFSCNRSTKKIIWINRFDLDKFSDKKSILCNALKIHAFPSEIFGILTNEPEYFTISKIDKKAPFTNNISNIIHEIKGNMAKKSLINTDSKIIFYINIISSLGRYKEAYNLSKTINLLTIKSPPQHSKLFLLNFSRLNHEVSKYSTCGKIANDLINLCKKDFKKNIDILIQAQCIKSESLRMSIPNDIYFSRKIRYKEAKRIIYVILHFIITSLNIRATLIINNIKINDISPTSQHEFIEHHIRFFAILQSILGSSQKGWGKNRRVILGKIWNHIKEKSSEYGYAAGIANSQKFKHRLYPNKEISLEATEIFDLTTSSTGNELMTRNHADILLKEKNYEEARIQFRKYILMANKSGNLLNEIKGYLGLAFTNSLEGKKPLLTSSEHSYFSMIIREVEGDLWKSYLSRLSKTFI